MMKTKRMSGMFKLLPLASVLLLSSCSSAVVLNSKGQVGAQESTLIAIAAGLMLLVVLPVIVMTFVFAWKYRASNKKAKYQPDWSHSNKIEAVMWLVPTVIIIALGTLSWITTHSLDPFKPLDTPGKPVKIEVVSMDWKWLFIYPDQGVASVNEVAFPAHRQVEFYLTSDTVMTSFFIPQLGSQIYTMAGMQTQLHLIADHPGVYDGIAANYSGAGFSGMTFKAHAVSESQFKDWIATAKNSSRTLDFNSYQQLAKPSENNPVEYFSSVSPHLFQQVLNKYMNDHTPSMASGSME
ncbi:ubiquinol oxidase subunit II [Salinispira pacifica]